MASADSCDPTGITLVSAPTKQGLCTCHTSQGMRTGRLACMHGKEPPPCAITRHAAVKRVAKLTETPPVWTLPLLVIQLVDMTRYSALHGYMLVVHCAYVAHSCAVQLKCGVTWRLQQENAIEVVLNSDRSADES